MKPTLPQGTRDFSAQVVRKRNYIFDTIKKSFELYGFQPLETPAMENLETLMGRYGDEGDKLIFKILNNGLELATKHNQGRQDFEQVLTGKSTKGITERALRYDLTIPFARHVSQHIGQIVLPFKRYQIQPVWRADKPQKGRYREFYQCDADVVGSKSLLNEVELAGMYHEVFKHLGIAVRIKLNNRKLLAGLAEICGGADKMTNITVAIDKLDKIGLEKVKVELENRGILPDQIETIVQYLSITGDNLAKLQSAKELFANNETAMKGLNELEFVLNYLDTETGAKVDLDFTLARGLNYYTGTIFEVKADNVQMGSIGGGGRYDDLTGSFDVPNVPGVGISFGVDRIYDVMEELKLFPDTVQTGTKVLFFNLGDKECKTAFGLMQKLRLENVACETYPDIAKFDKQFKYADKKVIPFIVIVGSKELEEKTCVVKNLSTGEQRTIGQNELSAELF